MAQYIIRLDDAHPKMNLHKWECIEHLLDQNNITPIVAVIPDNKDSGIDFSHEGDSRFWEKVNFWVRKGWTVAMHGSHHALYPAPNSLMRFASHSEFTGQSFNCQFNLLKEGYNILLRHGIRTRYFVAPAHGFDSITIQALLKLDPKMILSGGLGVTPYISSDGIFVLPQQLWKYRWLPFGLWTICLHPSTMSDLEILNLKRAIESNPRSFSTDIASIKFHRASMFELFLQHIHQFALRFKQF